MHISKIELLGLLYQDAYHQNSPDAGPLQLPLELRKFSVLYKAIIEFIDSTQISYFVN